MSAAQPRAARGGRRTSGAATTTRSASRDAWFRSGELLDRGARLARGLVELGVKPGDRVVVMMENSPDVGVVYHAIARAGAVVTPVIFLVSAEELRRIDPRRGAGARDRVAARRSRPSRPRRTACPSSPTSPSSSAASRCRSSPRDDDDLAALVYTGGTTGRAKGVMLTHANLWEAGRRGHEAGHVDGIDRSLSCLPLVALVRRCSC